MRKTLKLSVTGVEKQIAPTFPKSFEHVKEVTVPSYLFHAQSDWSA